jgi:NADPH:quinone reductase-like Zn-dependent oxidoreductase
MWRLDDYIEPVAHFPAVLGYEAAGIIGALGEGVTGFAVGLDEPIRHVRRSCHCAASCAGEAACIAVLHQAASIWMMFVTAYGTLIEDAKVGKGDFVLIPAASSSVGLAAIQIANHAGATPIALTRTSEKKQQLLNAGAAHVIVTSEADLLEEAIRITAGKGARVAFDPVGGETFAKLISALSFQGILYLYGALATPRPRCLSSK